MKHFLKYAAVVCLLPALGFVASASASDDELGYVEGIEYQRVAPVVQASRSDKIQVVEMFWYRCPHCYHFEPHVSSWKKKLSDNVEFIRVPAIFNDQWALLAQAYYTAEILDVLDKVHTPMFKRIHEEKGKLNDPDAIRAIFVENGVDGDAFDKTFKSFGVKTRMARAKKLGKAWRIAGVPSMIVDGEFVTSGTMAGTHQELIKVVDHLIQQQTAKSVATN